MTVDLQYQQLGSGGNFGNAAAKAERTLTLPLFSVLVMIRAVAWWNSERKHPSPHDATAPPPGAEI